MLTTLYIKNYILIDELNLSFETGFSAFTGETGAGKSILIDAIGILCGDKFTTDLIRHGQERSILEAVFLTSQPQVLRILDENGIAIESKMLIVSRELNRDGRSFTRVNGRNVTVGMLRELTSYLIDIHSQHDTQYLLNNKTHLGLLDEFEPNDVLSRNVSELYHAYHVLERELDEKRKNNLNPDDLDFLSFQLKEIDVAALNIGEDEQLEARQKLLMNFEKNSLRLSSALDLLDESDGVSLKLHEAVKLLNSVDEIPGLGGAVNRIQELYYEMLDKISDVRQVQSKLGFDEDELNVIQERLFLIGKLKKKFGRSIEAIFETRKEILAKIELIENRFEILDKLEKAKNEAYKRFYDQAVLLSIQRKNKAERLEMAVLSQCRDLFLDKAQFTVQFNETKGNQSGIDAVEFLISMNPGEPLKPLVKVASGGELSRLMLGLKVVFNQLQKIDTVIFDEIDAGVSGRIATSIGQKMHMLGKSAQVFSVTHLGQVAACAKIHYFVSKSQGTESTSTMIERLDVPNRIRELSLISSGTLSETSLSAATEMLEENQRIVSLL